MWPQLFLPVSVLFALQTLHTVINPLIAKHCYGNQWAPKNLNNTWILHYYHRDFTRSLDAMRPFGVEAIPDVAPKITDL